MAEATPMSSATTSMAKPKGASLAASSGAFLPPTTMGTLMP
jgi:hypothetical protein